MLVGCGLLGWFYPELSAFASGQGDVEPAILYADSTSTLETAQEPQRDHWLAGETVLERQADGHFYANVTAGAVALRMMVDTGATVVALTGEDAHSLGLHWSDADIVPVGKGANGTVYGVSTQISRIQLDDIEAYNVRAIIVPEGLSVSLLGQSFLSEVDRVQIVENEMVLGG